MRKHLSTLLLVLVFIAGLSLMLYPTVSDYWNSLHQSGIVRSYAETVTEINDEEYSALWEEAARYNTELAKTGSVWVLSDDEIREYHETLKVTEDGMMACIDIPKIQCYLPIYHGTEEVLQTSIGHLMGSSLPVGGESSHCILSGHRGLPSAKLFSHLDQLVEGDTFMIYTLDETLTYEVDRILIVEPEETKALEITEGKDYCTLVTCTPYGINTHRLLVRGHRVENAEVQKEIHVSAEAMQIEPIVVAPLVAVPILLILLVWVLVRYRKK